MSDPGIFINDMLDRKDNRAFALDLIEELLPEGGEVIFDESVHIPPGYLSNGAHTFLSSIYFTKSHIYLNAIFLIIVIILVELAIILVKDPVKLFRPAPMRNQASNVRYLKKSLARSWTMGTTGILTNDDPVWDGGGSPQS